MRGRSLSRLGLLGLLGLLGVATGNVGFYGFFGFFGFFGLAYTESDERMELNILRAARNAFVVTMILLAGSIGLAGAMRPGVPLLASLLGLIFALHILTFCFSYVFYDRKGD